MENQAKLELGGSEVISHLPFGDVAQSLGGFYLNNDASFYEHVDSVSADEHAAKVYLDRVLALDQQTSRRQGNLQGARIDRLNKAEPEFVVHLHGRTYDEITEVLLYNRRSR